MTKADSGHSSKDKGRSFQSIIKRNYIFALVLIAILALLSHSGLYLAIKTNDMSAALINVSGRQRMLSQRAAIYSLRLVNSRDDAIRDKLREGLRETANQMEESHAALLRGQPGNEFSPSGPSGEVKAIFFEAPVRLDKKMRMFLGEVRALSRETDERLTNDNPHLQRILDMSGGDLLEALETLVTQYQKESEDMISRLKGMGIGVFGMIIFVLFMEDLFIFRPVAGRVEKEAQRIKLLQEIAVAANEAETVEDVMRVSLEKICENTGWEVGHVYVPDPKNKLIPTYIWWLKDVRRFGAFREATESYKFPPGVGLPGRVLKSGKPAWIIDVTRDPNFPRALSAEEVGIKTGFAFPVLEGDRVVAVLEFYTTKISRPDEALIEIIESLAIQLGRVTERKRVERELIAAKETAEKATELKDKFVSLVAHDLRSPLATVMGFLEAICSDKSNPLQEAHRKGLTHVRDNVNGLINMIDRLLNITRLRTGKIKPQRKFIDGRRLAAMVVKNYRHMAEKKGVALVNNVPEGVRLYADPDLFAEVLRNLVNNAIKFCRDGDTVTLFTPPDKQSTISVKDSGLGVDADILPDIFKHDVKTTMKGTAGEKGTGLGLPFCHDIIMAHEGSLTVESMAGAGSVFHAEIPVRRPLVLVVDDEDDVRYTFRMMLERLDMEVVEADGCDEALSIMKNMSPHLVILDIIMPVKDGFEFMERAKKECDAGDVPIVVVTSDHNVETSERAFSLGARDVVNKPVAPNVFIPKVRRLVEEVRYIV